MFVLPKQNVCFMITYDICLHLVLRNGEYRPRSTKTKTEAHQDNGSSVKKATTQTNVAASREQAHLQLVQGNHDLDYDFKPL